MFKGTILVVDDTPVKVNRIVCVAEGIVLDSQFFLKVGDKSGADDAGNQMLSWLEKEGKEILVLGFSNKSFQTKYRHFWGRMGQNMLFDKGIFEKFLFSLPTKKDQG